MILSVVDYAQLSNIEPYTAINNPITMERIYDEQKDNTLKTPEGTEYTLAEIFTREEFAQLTTDSKKTETNVFGREVEVNLYTKYVVPARQACAGAAGGWSPP